MGRKPSTRRPVPDIGVDPAKLVADEVKALRLNIRVSRTERAEIAATAKRLNLPISDYMLGLHAQCVLALASGRVLRKGARHG